MLHENAKELTWPACLAEVAVQEKHMYFHRVTMNEFITCFNASSAPLVTRGNPTKDNLYFLHRSQDRQYQYAKAT